MIEAKNRFKKKSERYGRLTSLTFLSAIKKIGSLAFAGLEGFDNGIHPQFDNGYRKARLHIQVQQFQLNLNTIPLCAVSHFAGCQSRILCALANYRTAKEWLSALPSHFFMRTRDLTEVTKQF